MNRDRPLRSGFEVIPNSLWTLDLSPKAILLLGWLHSHADNYRDALSIRRIGREFGGGTHVTRLVDQLANAGWITKEPAATGWPARVIVRSDPWEQLFTGARVTRTPRTRHANRGARVTRTGVHASREHREHQLVPVENSQTGSPRACEHRWISTHDGTCAQCLEVVHG